MSPEIFDTLYIISTGSLIKSPESHLWAAANKTLGSNWVLDVLPTPLSKPLPVALPTNNSPISSANPKAGMTMVVSRAPRTYQTFFMLVLPAVNLENTEPATEQMRQFYDVLHCLFDLDSTSVPLHFSHKGGCE